MNAQNEKHNIQTLKLVPNQDGWKNVVVNGENSAVPTTWEVKKLGECAEIRAGQSPDGQLVYSGVPDDNRVDFHQGNADFSSNKTAYSGKVIERKNAPKLAPAGSLLMSVRAPVGALNFASNEVCFGRGLANIQATDSSCINYLRWKIASSTGKLIQVATGSTFLAVTNQQVSELQISLPPFFEQQRIASVLTSQESRIENLRAWAQTERDRLTWLTDELLSGRVRVVERSGDSDVVVERDANGQAVEKLGAYELVDNTHQNAPWVNTTVRKIGKSTSGATPPTSDKQYWGGGLIWVTPKDMDDLDGPYIKTSEKKLTQAGYDFMERKKVSAGSVIFSTRGSIGKVAAAKKEMRISQSCESFSFGDSSPEFMVYLFRWKMAEIKEKGAGTTFMSITKKDIEDIEISIPEKHEQQRIAAVLSAQERQVADIEKLIELEQQRLSWLTEELLSGRVRVAENT